VVAGVALIISENPGTVNHAANGGTINRQNKPPMIQ